MISDLPFAKLLMIIESVKTHAIQLILKHLCVFLRTFLFR